MKRRLNIGVVGCANIAQRSVIPAILNLREEFNLIGIASRDEKKAIQFANQFQVKTYPSYNSLLQQKGLDAVYIPLPNALHAEWIERSLNAGIHVLCEKSLGCNLDEVAKVNQLAEKRKLVLLENFQFRFHSQLAFILKQVKENKIGELRCIRSSFGFPPFASHENIRYFSNLGGGALLDVGAYTLKISQIFMGYNINVISAVLNAEKAHDVDIWGGAFITENQGELFSEVAFGFDNYYQCNLEIWGNKGRLRTNRIFTAPPNYSPEIEIETNSGKENIILSPDNHFEKMLKHFYNLIVIGQGLQEEYTQNVNQARLIEELRKKSYE